MTSKTNTFSSVTRIAARIVPRALGRNSAWLVAGLAAAVFSTSCGRPGKPTEKIEVPLTGDQTKKDPTIALAPITNINFESMRSTPPLPVGCAKISAGPMLTILPADFDFQGDVTKWPAAALLWDDPVADSHASVDIGKVYGAFRDKDLLLAVSSNAISSNGFVTLEFGGLRVKDGNLDTRVVHEFRLSSNGIEERDGTRWTPLSAVSGQVLAANAGIEARISIRMVADIMNWPAWWLRVSSQASNTVGSDSTSSRYFPSLLDGDEERFGFSTCNGWGNDRMPFSFTEITDRRVRDLYPADPTAPVDKGADQASDDIPPVLWDFNSLGLVRRAYDSVTALLGYQSLGVDNLTIITSLKTGDQVKGSLPGSDETARFGYIFAEARRLAKSSTDTAAYEEIFATATSQMLRIHANASGYLAPKWLQEVYAAALQKHLLDSAVGRIFVLNQFRASVEPFLTVAIPNAAEDLSLRTGTDSSNQAFVTAKAVAFSHLLWANFDAKTIVSAWKTAAPLFGASTFPDESFRSALIQAADQNYPGRSNLALVDRIWAGWIIPGDYEVSMKPSSFLDKDKDGLPDFLENATGFSSAKADTDLDGWSDLVSYVRLGAGKPNRTLANIVADGSFDDWARLLPQRINLHRGQSGACPEVANISHFGALVSTTGILLGAHSESFPESGAVRWEAQIDFPEIKRQILLTNEGTGFDVLVSDATTKKPLKKYSNPRAQGTQSLEWAVNFAELGLDPNLIKITLKNSVSSRLRTIYRRDGLESYCDETNWFEANVVQ